MQKSEPKPNNTRFQIRPASPEEAGLFYAQLPAEDKRLGAIGHVRMDFGRSGNEFWNTWWPRGPEELNSPAFKSIAVPVAEAKFFRAYCYFELMQLYGNVILLTEPVDIDSPKMNAVRERSWLTSASV